MKTERDCPLIPRLLRPAVLLGFVAGVLLPPFVVGTAVTEYQLGGMSAEASDRIFLPAYTWSVTPGRLVLAIVGLEALPMATHTVGWFFWRELGLQSLANWLGWSLIFLIVQLLLTRLSMNRSRSHPTSAGSPLDATPGGRSPLRWKLILASGFVLGALLPFATLGVVSMAAGGASEALWTERAPGMGLVHALLMPGSTLLLFSDFQLSFDAEYRSLAIFWRSYSLHLLANWAAWTVIALLSRLAWLRWLRNAFQALQPGREIS